MLRRSNQLKLAFRMLMRKGLHPCVTAPTYLPAHSFETKTHHGDVLRNFDLIDDDVATNNPVHA